MKSVDSTGQTVDPLAFLSGITESPALYLIIGGVVAYLIGVVIMGNRGDGGIYLGDSDSDGDGD